MGLDYYHMSSLTRGIQNLLWQEPEREQKPIPGARFGKETVAEYIEGQNGPHIIVRRPDSGVLRMLRFRSGSLRLAQALLWHAHPQLMLKQ